MSDERLKRAWTVLEPSEAQRVQVEERVVTAWESRQRSLFSEWLDVLRARPLLNGAWVLAAMAVLVFTTPVGALLTALPKLQSVAVTSRSTPVERERPVELLGTGTVVESLAAILGLRHERCLGQRCLALVSPAVGEAPGRLAHEDALRE
ncbi:MAG: hypothetical protein ABTQ32_12950 [Myxococcaceae bacterium]